jgi:hypothetical protein
VWKGTPPLPAEIESFEAAQRAKRAGLAPHQLPVAERYIGRAEESLRLLAAMSSDIERRAIFQITETWLSLAEASLRPQSQS